MSLSKRDEHMQLIGVKPCQFAVFPRRKLYLERLGIRANTRHEIERCRGTDWTGRECEMMRARSCKMLY